MSPAPAHRGNTQNGNNTCTYPARNSKPLKPGHSLREQGLLSPKPPPHKKASSAVCSYMCMYARLGISTPNTNFNSTKRHPSVIHYIATTYSPASICATAPSAGVSYETAIVTAPKRTTSRRRIILYNLPPTHVFPRLAYWEKSALTQLFLVPCTHNSCWCTETATDPNAFQTPAVYRTPADREQKRAHLVLTTRLLRYIDNNLAADETR